MTKLSNCGSCECDDTFMFFEFRKSGVQGSVYSDCSCGNKITSKTCATGKEVYDSLVETWNSMQDFYRRANND